MGNHIPRPFAGQTAYLEANMPLSQLKNNDTHYIDASDNGFIS